MLIVGELINTSRKAVKEAVMARDAAFIRELALRQSEAGADYLDVNCGTMLSDEKSSMEWLVNVIAETVTVPLCIDSPDAAVLEAGLALCRNGQPMINSATLESARYEAVVPLARKYGAKLVALCISDRGMPAHIDDRTEIADELIERLTADGIALDDIYIDPLIKPISADITQGRDVLEAVRRMMTTHPGVHTICGLTNISFNLPERIRLNATFMLQTMACGMDSYIIDITNKQMAAALLTGNVLMGQDKFCRKYIKGYRNGLFE